LPTENPAKASPPFLCSGTLFVVATPIGNMEDITFRAIRTLTEAGLIAAEDTRQTRKLLARYKISTPLVSFHDHNKEKRAPALLQKLRSGISVALVTDAGTPSISDPGYYLVKEAIREALPVIPVPGASASVAALSVSGLPTDSFVFVGFAPRKANRRIQLLDSLKDQPRTLVFYESPKRLLGLIETMIKIMGDRDAVMARELTKIHEEIFRDKLTGMAEELSQRSSLKGECTLLVAGHGRKEEIDQKTIQCHLKRLRQDKNCSLSDLVKEVARKHRLPKKAVYDAALKLKKE